MSAEEGGYGDLLQLIDTDPLHKRDGDRIRATILADGRANDGRISANRVREALTNDGGHLDVYPRCIGPAYNGLVRSGLIRTLGYIDVNRDQAGRNYGKPAMAYALTEAGWSA